MRIKESLRTLFYKSQPPQQNSLITIWGETLDSISLLSEYPRPTLVRDNYTILNGYWDYAITKSSQFPESYTGKILVPFSPESQLSGLETSLQPDEFLWYHLELSLETIPIKKRCILHFQAVDYACQLYMNKKLVGQHTGGYLPFSLDVTDFIQPGNNTVILQVQDATNQSGQARGKQSLNPKGIYYTGQSGIWQTVWYEWVPDIYVDSYQVETELDGSVHFQLSTNKPIDQLEITLSLNGQIITSSSYNHNAFSLTIPEEKLHLWDTENPTLYTFTAKAGKDQFSGYFAFRTIEIKTDPASNKKKIYLNGKKIFINGVLDQGYWPDGLMTAPSDDALIYDIKKAKELGFNMLRKHIKIESHRFYYHCDRLGMLVCQDMVNGGKDQNPFFIAYLPTALPFVQGLISDKKHRSWFGQDNKKDRDQWLEEMDATVGHLKNHPSIIMWCPFNEGWGQFDSEAVYQRIKQLDATRLIDHASGWYDQKCGDFVSIHNYFRKLSMVKDSRCYMISEFGGYACHIKGHSFANNAYGYKVFANKEELNKAYLDLYKNEVTPLISKGLAGVVYTQLSDVESEVNGLMTYDRKVCKIENQGLLHKNI